MNTSKYVFFQLIELFGSAKFIKWIRPLPRESRSHSDINVLNGDDIYQKMCLLKQRSG
jgi:hypothetical protein